jgi:hypothetical protein
MATSSVQSSKGKEGCLSASGRLEEVVGSGALPTRTPRPTEEDLRPCCAGSGLSLPASQGARSKINHKPTSH